MSTMGYTEQEIRELLIDLLRIGMSIEDTDAQGVKTILKTVEFFIGLMEEGRL